MKIKLALFLLVATMLRTFALNVEDIIAKTRAKYENMNSFYAEFEQVYCDEETGTCRRFEGKTYFMKPNFFRMEMENPKSIYVGDSSSLWIYLPDENRAIRQSLTQMPFQINPDMFLRDYEDKFNAELTEEQKEYYLISLTSKDETDIYRKIIIKIKSKSFEIAGISVFDEIGSESKFEFDKIEINKKLSKKLFQFNPPKGTKVDEY